MNLTIVIEGLREDLQGIAELGDERSAQIARRLTDALSSSLRLKVLDLLGQAALELSSKLPSGHVEVRLAGQEPELVFVDDATADAAGTVGEELSARITLRLPESLKTSVERAADREGISTNAWLIRAIARATESRPTHVTGKRLSGYAQS
jgi:hypothetical protein